MADDHSTLRSAHGIMRSVADVHLASLQQGSAMLVEANSTTRSPRHVWALHNRVTI